MSGRPLCRLADLQESDARGYDALSSDGKELSLIVVRRGGDVHVYVNRCPHTGINLEWQPDTFMDGDGNFLQCAMHGALFRPEDGYCVMGPCAGDSLTPVPVRIVDGLVVVDI